MTETSKENPKKRGRNGGFLGGILGMLMWFNQPADLLNVGKFAEWAVFVAFMALCVFAGTVIERMFSRDR